MLESYGVFRCPACGRVDIEGHPIPEGETQPAHEIRTGSASFVAPPIGLTLPEPTRAGIPRFLLAMIVVQAILTVLGAMGPGGSILRLVLRFTVFGGLLIGHRGAYRYAMVALVLSMLLGGMSFLAVWVDVPPTLRLLVLVGGLIDVAFLVALLRPEARRYYES